MMNNGNREIFKRKYNLKDTDACIFIERMKNRKAQHKKEHGKSIGQDHCYYTIHDELSETYKTIDHFSKFYSSKHDCYIITAQPYHFDENIEAIKGIWKSYGLSFVIIDELSWHYPGSCKLYAIGSYDNIIKIFGKVDLDGRKMK